MPDSIVVRTYAHDAIMLTRQIIGKDADALTLSDAIRTMNTPATIQIVSDATNAASVRADPANAMPTPPAPIPHLHGPLQVRPIDVLLRLARATAPRAPLDVFLAYANWSWLKYLGAFVPRAPPGSPLQLSSSAVGVSHNQRRVMSEELGIAFGLTVAEHWCLTTGSYSAFRAIDGQVPGSGVVAL